MESSSSTYPAAEFDDTTTLSLSPKDPSRSTIPVDRTALQTLMWTNVGIERTRTNLEAAATQLNQWHAEGTSVHALETANLLALARVIVAAALAREESRGAHFRNDFPETSTAFQHSLVHSSKAVLACL
jgi:L-aspartate oxidase